MHFIVRNFKLNGSSAVCIEFPERRLFFERIIGQRKWPVVFMLALLKNKPTIGFGKFLGTALYHEKVNDHFKNPRNTGSMDEKAKDVGTGIVGAPACGDTLQFQIRVDKKTQRIKEVKFLAFGCPAAVASSSLATTLIEGKTIEEALQVKNTTIANELKLPPVKMHCSMLAQDAIRSAVESYRKKHAERQKKLEEEKKQTK